MRNMLLTVCFIFTLNLLIGTPVFAELGNGILYLGSSDVSTEFDDATWNNEKHTGYLLRHILHKSIVDSKDMTGWEYSNKIVDVNFECDPCWYCFMKRRTFRISFNHKFGNNRGIESLRVSLPTKSEYEYNSRDTIWRAYVIEESIEKANKPDDKGYAKPKATIRIIWESVDCGSLKKDVTLNSYGKIKIKKR